MQPTNDDHLHVPGRTLVGGDKRIDVLEAAIEVIVRRGFDSTRYADVSEASGVAVSTLQYYFGSLEAMLVESCLHASERDFQRATEELARHPDVWERLQYMVRVFMTSDTPGPHWQAQLEYWRAAFTRPWLRESLVRDQNRWRALITDTIREGLATGVFTTERDPEVLAMQINCLVDGTVFPAFAGNPDYDAAAFLAAVVDDLRVTLRVRGG